MFFPLFASFIIFTAWLAFHMHHRAEVEESHMESFWEKEQRANSTRRKPLDDLNYITIPTETLPMNKFTDNERIADCLSRLQILMDEKIVNLTGISNTDLKLTYGAPNITLLARYDQNYTILARTLQEWGNELYTLNQLDDAVTVLEFAVSTHTDISATYRLLKTIYEEQNEPDKIFNLLETAKTLQSASKDAILHILEL